MSPSLKEGDMGNQPVFETPLYRGPRAAACGPELIADEVEAETEQRL